VKLQCELCREIVVADFAVVGGAIEVRCPACARTFTVTATRSAEVLDLARARPARPAAGSDEHAMRCPKCDDEQPAAPACRSCGLLAARMADFARDRDAQVAPEVVAAWGQLEERWSDPDAHDGFIRTVAAAMSYPWAAQRYREALRLRPDDAVAADQLARLARMAEATLFATAARKETQAARPYRGAITLLAAMTLLIIVGIGYALLTRALREEPPPAERAPKTTR